MKKRFWLGSISCFLMICMLAVTAHRISIHNGYAAAAKHKAQSYRRGGSELLVSTGLGNLRASECGTSNKVSPSLFLGSVRKPGCTPSYNPIKIIFLCHETMASITNRIS